MGKETASDAWIDEILGRSRIAAADYPEEKELADLLIKTCFANKPLSPERFGLLLASAFDLLVAGQYFSAMTHTGWFYCPNPTPRLFFPFTNCCPRHVLRDGFYFHPSNKPASGRIGTATSRLLLLYYQLLFRHQGFDEEVFKGTEPVDAIIVNRKKNKILFAEIKASPLVTPAVSTNTQALTIERDGTIVERPHAAVDNTSFFNNDLQILIPRADSKGNWNESYFILGQCKGAKDRTWGYRGITSLLKGIPDFFPAYFSFWKNALKTYHPKDTHAVYWLTNACGTPSPIPNDWPARRQGDGYESVSDSKTSVGMDRTDDIKKGIYQVLKLGSQGKPSTRKWDYKVGLISNIHAARHFDEYLESIKDIIWTIDVSGKAKKVSDLSADQPLYNLFDGLVALTSTLSRDEWLERLFSPLQ